MNAASATARSPPSTAALTPHHRRPARTAPARARPGNRAATSFFSLARIAVDRLPSADFPTPVPIEARVIGACYTDLWFDDTGRAETVLADSATGAQNRVR